ncbi:MAG: family 16 glycoside hydrolase, partial [Verrucomicrobiota bacterium]
QLKIGAENAVGEWNKMEVVSDRGNFVVRLNGKTAIAGQSPKPVEGAIMLQSHNGAIRFRNLSVVNFDTWQDQYIEAARDGETEKAAHLFGSMLAYEPVAMDTIRGLWLATLYSANEDRQAHETLCTKLFARYGNPANPTEASRPAKAYVMMPGVNDLTMLNKALESIKFANENGPKSGSFYLWFRLTRGMAEYRSRNYEEALKFLQQPMNGGAPIRSAPAYAYAAMANYKNNDLEKGRQLLKQAEGAYSKINQNDALWNDVLGAKIALDEARDVVR